MEPIMGEEVSFATLNLLNLHKPGEPIYRDTNGLSQREYDEKVAWTAAMVSQLDVDILGLQEVWNEDVLDDVLDEAGLSDEYQVLATTRGNAISCAAFVRTELEVTGEPNWVEEFPDEFVLEKDTAPYAMKVEISRFSRPVLEFDVRLRDDTDPVRFWVAHLKSKAPISLDSEDEDRASGHDEPLGHALSMIRRGAEAAALRIRIRKALDDTDRPGVLMGDLNDHAQSVPLSILAGDPGHRMNIYSRTGWSSDHGLYAVSDLQKYRSLRDVYYTYIHNHRRQSIDHILVSEQFYDHSTDRIWSFKDMVVTNDYLSEFDNEGTEGGRSDHAAVKARFVYDPYD
jgi:endonuclease/exonuclease/phosphatase family metal-dependent hydrolase